jgi:hypothetical protein
MPRPSHCHLYVQLCTPKIWFPYSPLNNVSVAVNCRLEFRRSLRLLWVPDPGACEHSINAQVKGTMAYKTAQHTTRLATMCLSPPHLLAAAHEVSQLGWPCVGYHASGTNTSHEHTCGQHTGMLILAYMHNINHTPSVCRRSMALRATPLVLPPPWC